MGEDSNIFIYDFCSLALERTEAINISHPLETKRTVD